MPDFAHTTEAIAVELDGLAFNSDPGTFQSDRHRQNRLVTSGWTVLRFTWRDPLAGSDWVLSTLQAALATTQLGHLPKYLAGFQPNYGLVGATWRSTTSGKWSEPRAGPSWREVTSSDGE